MALKPDPDQNEAAHVDIDFDIANLSPDKKLNELLKSVIVNEKLYAEDQIRHIKQLAQIGLALSAERDITKLLEIIVDEARQLSNADGGTLFLDEVGNTPVEFQKNVLRVIEYQEFERIGGTRTIKVDVRVVAATNADLDKEIEEGRFRADLYDRLRFTEIQLPALRERSGDIRPLVEFFSRELSREVPSISHREFSGEAIAAMEFYPWPGNVRELKFAVERALCVAREERVGVGDLPPEVRGGDFGNQMSGGTFDEHMAAVEGGLLSRALSAAGNSQKEAASILGLTYDRFRHLLRKHGAIGGS